MEKAAVRSTQIYWLGMMSCLLLAAALLAVPAARADIFVWEDDQGVIHFSNQEAPPGSKLYMREPEPKPAESTPVAAEDTTSGAQPEMQARLDRANRRLDRALDRVDDLTEKVRDSQQEAAVSAALAKQAAEFSIAGANQVASEPERDYGRRVVYYGAPAIVHSKSGRLGRHDKSFHFSHRRFKHLNKFKHHHEKSHHNKFKRGGHVSRHKPQYKIINKFKHNPRARSLHRSRIPKAYGIR